MRCLCCGKLLSSDSSEYEQNVQWHRSCIRRFFGTEFLPDLNGKKRNLRRKDFLSFAAACGISGNAAAKMIARIVSLKGEYLRQCRDSYIPEEYKRRFFDLIENRIAVLTS